MHALVSTHTFAVTCAAGHVEERQTAASEGSWRWILPVLGAFALRYIGTASLLEHRLKAHFNNNMEPTLILP
jgi:hypothetical protein